MVIFVKKDNKTNLWYVKNAIVIAGHVFVLAYYVQYIYMNTIFGKIEI